MFSAPLHVILDRRRAPRPQTFHLKPPCQVPRTVFLVYNDTYVFDLNLRVLLQKTLGDRLKVKVRSMNMSLLKIILIFTLMYGIINFAIFSCTTRWSQKRNLFHFTVVSTMLTSFHNGQIYYVGKYRRTNLSTAVNEIIYVRSADLY